MNMTPENQTAPQEPVTDVVPQPTQPTEPARAVLFVDDADALKTIDLGGGNWVKVPTVYDGGFVEDLKINKDDAIQTSRLLSKVIKEWNLLDKTGAVAPINQEHVRKLPVACIMQIATVVNKDVEEQVTVPKDELPPSEMQ